MHDAGSECGLAVPFDIELVQPGSNGVHLSTRFHSQLVPCGRSSPKSTWQNPKYFEDERRNTSKKAKLLGLGGTLLRADKLRWLCFGRVYPAIQQDIGSVKDESRFSPQP